MSRPASPLQIKVPGGTLHAQAWPGRSAAPPLVLLHDSLGSVAQWRGFPAALRDATGRTVWAWDRLGYGRSTPRTTGLGPDLFDAEAETFFPAIMAAIGSDTGVLLGHSIGAPMALTLAARHPRWCRAVVSVSGQAFVHPMTLAAVRRAHATFDAPERFARLARFHGERTRWVLDSWPTLWFDPAFRDWSLDPVLPHVACPVLVIHGGRDEYGPAAFPERIVESVAGPASLWMPNDGGHFPHVTHADAVLARVKAFLATHAM